MLYWQWNTTIPGPRLIYVLWTGKTTVPPKARVQEVTVIIYHVYPVGRGKSASPLAVMRIGRPWAVCRDSC